MNKKDVLNKVIPADNLNWVEGEGFTLLSEKEILDIIHTCQKTDMKEQDIFKAVKWCESTRTGELLWNSFLNGNISIHHFNDNNEPVFYTNEK
jgi:hypothetical protein